MTAGYIMNQTPEKLWLAALLLMGVALQTYARQTARHVGVGATVQAYAHPAATQPSQLVITNKDVNLGYVAVPNSYNPSRTQLTVTTNDRAGYTLVFQVAASGQPLFASIQITGLGTNVVLPASGGRVTMAYTGATAKFTLSYRFNLASKVKDGTYGWPLTVGCQPN
jgi:hypothetical protein